MPPNWNEGIRTKSNLPQGYGIEVYVFEPRQRPGVQVEQRIAVARDLGGVRLAVEHPKHAAVACRRFNRELPRREREEIGRQRRRLLEHDLGRAGFALSNRLGRAARTVCHRLPAVRNREPQPVARLQIRLVEARKGEPRARGHEQRVKEFVVAIQRLVTRDELELDAVGAGARRLRRDDDVAVDEVRARHRLRRR